MSERMMRLTTGEMTETEWLCRNAWSCAELDYWWSNPANAERQAEIMRNYIAAMQRDPRLD